MNSFSNMEMAIESEIRRQIRPLHRTHPHENPEELIVHGTYRYDPERKQTILMRRKESAEDYRYFPEPDLVPIVLTESYIDQIGLPFPSCPTRDSSATSLSYDSLPSAAIHADQREKALLTILKRRLRSVAIPQASATGSLSSLPAASKRRAKHSSHLAFPLPHRQTGPDDRSRKDHRPDRKERRRRHGRPPWQRILKPSSAENPDYQPHRQSRGDRKARRSGPRRKPPIDRRLQSRQGTGIRLPRRASHEALLKAKPPRQIVNELLNKKLSN